MDELLLCFQHLPQKGKEEKETFGGARAMLELLSTPVNCLPLPQFLQRKSRDKLTYRDQ
jgi:hypothetical protein